MKIINNANMKEYTTYKTGGIVKELIIVENKDELKQLILKLRKESKKYFILGNCSNVIVDDDYFDGVIINLKEMKNICFENNYLNCEAGCMIPLISKKAIDNSLKGLEWAISIPGTVGGCIYNNAGAYNSEMKDVIEEVTVLDKDLNEIKLSNKECDFSYRNSIFKNNKDLIIISCKIKLNYSDKQSMKDIVNDRLQRRIASQPLEYPSAGSVFRNPINNFAGKLIEELELKGFNIGGAKVSEKHANFIINTGNATSKDIKDLIKYIKEKVKDNYQIDLINEQEEINWE